MKIIKIDAVKTKDLTSDPLMTGGAVEATFLITPDIAKELGMGIIKFAPGLGPNFIPIRVNNSCIVLTARALWLRKKRK